MDCGRVGVKIINGDYLGAALQRGWIFMNTSTSSDVLTHNGSTSDTHGIQRGASVESHDKRPDASAFNQEAIGGITVGNTASV